MSMKMGMMMMVMMVMKILCLLGRLGDLLGKGTIRLLGGKGLAPFWGGSYHHRATQDLVQFYVSVLKKNLCQLLRIHGET